MSVSEFRALQLRRSSALALLVAVIGAQSPALAQENAGQPQAASSSLQEAFNIPSKPLLAALADFTAQTGIQVVHPGSGAISGRSGVVQGSMSAPDALARILAGSGLAWRFTSARTVVLEQPCAQPAAVGSVAADGSVVLDGVYVQSRIESAWGPVDGYIARQSATGTKTDTSILETPQSISVVTRDQVEAQGAQNVPQALRYSAGVVPEMRGTNSRNDIPFIRGFGSPTDPVMFMDGLRLQRGAGYALPQAETYGVERVELLKGPSSILYGSATPGGLINVVSKRPTEESRGEVEFLAGSYQRFQGAFDVSGPMDEDKTLLYRIVGLARDADTQVDSTKEQRFYIAPSFTWKPDEDTSFTLLASYQKDPEGGYYGVLPTVGTLLPNPNGSIPRDFNEGDPSFSEYDREQVAVGYEFEHRFDETWKIRHNFRYLNLNVATDDLLTFGLQPDQRTISRYALSDRERLDGIASDLQLQADFETGEIAHRALFGFDYQYIDWRQQQNIGYPEGIGGGNVPPIDFLDPVYGITTPINLAPLTNQQQTLSQAGFYAQDQLKLGKLSLLLGGRYDVASTDTDNRLTGVLQDQDDGAFSGRIGAVYEFDNGIAPYASFSTSFLPITGTDYTGAAMQPTTAEQFEVGVKYQPTGFDGLFTLAYFDITQHDVVTAVNPILRYQNGKVRSRGVELEARVALNDSVNVTAAFTYTDARVLEGIGFDAGNAPLNIPEYTGSLWADYTFSGGALEGLMLGAGVRYIGTALGGYVPNVTTAPATPLNLPGYTLVDAALRYDLEHIDPTFEGYTFKLNATNLFDRKYVTCNANNFCNYGYGRSVFASLAYRW